MGKFSATIAKLAALRAAASTPAAPSGRLSELTAFGPNPGALKGRTYIPSRSSDRPALVVVLHGCTQTADGYDFALDGRGSLMSKASSCCFLSNSAPIIPIFASTGFLLPTVCAIAAKSCQFAK